MIKRYANKQIEKIFSDTNKTFLWQEMELAVLQAKTELNLIPRGIYEEIARIWHLTPIDLEWWYAKDEEIHHDLNAFIMERIRHLSKKLQVYVHHKMTSFDTEETPFFQMLQVACKVEEEYFTLLDSALVSLSLKNRYVVKIARTHGQEAEMKSLGATNLTWIADLRMAQMKLRVAIQSTYFSKFSGAVGGYGSISPIVEKTTLKILGFEPYYGSTQIMPRVIHASLAQALENVVLVVDKIANDIRLSARSGRPLLQEPFKKKQTGSTAMPHKKNPIQLEQIEGLARLAKAATIAITDNIRTWEERSIEQSSVERVAWPDLFHLVIRALDILKKVVSGMTVYRDNMIQEIIDSRGVYASSEVKEFLKEKLESHGLDYENCYHLVQLACFNIFEVGKERQSIRDIIPESLLEADSLILATKKIRKEKIVSIEDFIPQGKLRVCEQLSVPKKDVYMYNRELRKLFKNMKVKEEWHKLFKPSFLLKNEDVLFEEILGAEVN